MATRLGNSDRRKERAIQQGLITRVGNRHRDPVRKAIKMGMNNAASRFEAEGSDTAARGLIEAERKRVEDAVRAMYRGAWETLGQRILRIAQQKGGAGAGEFKQGEGEPQDAFDEAMRAFIAEQTAQQTDRILQTTGDQFRQIITQGEREGVGTDEIARRIRVQSDTLSQVRAQVIARTETHKAANASQTQAARASRVATRREWISAGDDRTRDDRFDHRAADGEVTTMDQPFVRTGESLDYPGDSVGSPGNVINCRCGTGQLVE